MSSSLSENSEDFSFFSLILLFHFDNSSIAFSILESLITMSEIFSASASAICSSSSVSDSIIFLIGFGSSGLFSFSFSVPLVLISLTFSSSALGLPLDLGLGLFSFFLLIFLDCFNGFSSSITIGLDFLEEDRSNHYFIRQYLYWYE